MCVALTSLATACGDAAAPRVLAHQDGELIEGQGCGPDGCVATCAADGCVDGRRPSLLVITSDQPLDSATARLVGAEVPVTVDVLASRTDGAMVWTAVAVRIPVASGLVAQSYPLELTVAGDGGTATFTTTAIGLPELVIADGPAPPDGRYASIVLPTAIAARLTGTAPVRLEATGDITLAGAVDVGGDADGPGPGGCAGAAVAADTSTCGAGGGLGSDLTFGGGGGYGTAGDTIDVPGGTPTGNPTLVPLGASATVDDDNRGHGGGAHRLSHGGHGGGTLLLSSRGAIDVGQYARITARGSDPGPSTSSMAMRGGGGSGGAVILAAGAGFTISPASTLVIDASGGWRGGDGRIRIDGAEPLPATLPAPWRGPRWLDVPLVVADGAALTLAVDARATAPIAVVADGVVIASCTPAAGACVVTPTLSVGVTRLCAQVRADRDPALLENRVCLDVARL